MWTHKSESVFESSRSTVVARLITQTMLMYIACYINIALLMLIAKGVQHAMVEERERQREREAAADLDLRCGYRSQLAKIDKEHSSKYTHIHTYISSCMCVSVC